MRQYGSWSRGGGKHYRETRMKYLGEDPVYLKGTDEDRVFRRVFG